MPGSTYSTNLKVELMATGENSGTWGDITNTNLGTALEQAIVGYGNPDYASDANLTISITNSNAAQAARALVLNVTSSVSLTATRELVVPTIQKQYIVQNNTTGSQSITVKTSAGTGITVPNGRKAHLYVNGTDVIQMFDFVDINGGAIDGTPIGASSASTGAFTTLNASGATTLDGNVTLGNASGDNVTVTGTITSNLLFTDNTYDIGASGATRPRNLFLAGAATIGGNLSVGGTLTLTGGVNLNGNVTVGDNATDTLTINSTITSNLIFTDNTYDIGASGATRPRNLFLAGSATIGGNQTLTGSLTVDSTTDSSSTITGSIQTDGGLGVAKALYVGTNVNIGGLTASKGVFTDGSKNLTSTGTLGTDQGGTGLTSFTANGVVYASSTSALTTGSALSFDGTTFAVNSAASIGSSTAKTKFYSDSTYNGIFNGASLGSNESIYMGGGAQFFYASGSEQMRLTSTSLYTASGINVGIGTSNPQAKLELGGTNPNMYFGPVATGSGAYLSYNTAGNYFAINAVTQGVGYRNIALANDGGNVGIGTSSPGTKLHVQVSALSGYPGAANAGALIERGNGPAALNIASPNTENGIIWFADQDSASVGNIRYEHSSNTLSLRTNGSDRFYLDSSGNLGLGVTPSASTFKMLQIGSSDNVGSLNQDPNYNDFAFGSNCYFDTTWKYRKTGEGASLFRAYGYDGQFFWQRAGSGTAGNTISWTTAMTLDANGSLLIGSTGTPTASAKVKIKTPSRTGTFFDLDATGGENWIIDSTNTVSSTDVLGIYAYGATGLYIQDNGNVGIGTTTPNVRLEVATSGGTAGQVNTHIALSRGTTNYAYLATERAAASNDVSALIFGVNSSERARITSDGILYVGTTTGFDNAYRINVGVSGATGGIIIQPGADNYTPVRFNNAAGTQVGTITASSTATTYGTGSDYRLKNNQQPLTGSGAFIDALQPKTWNWTADGSRGVGFIAHEVQEVSPGSVVGTKDAVDEEGKPIMQAMEYGSAEFIANIIAELQSLRARVAQLEAK